MCYHIKKFQTLHLTDMKFIKILWINFFKVADMKDFVEFSS